MSQRRHAVSHFTDLSGINKSIEIGFPLLCFLKVFSFGFGPASEQVVAEYKESYLGLT